MVWFSPTMGSNVAGNESRGHLYMGLGSSAAWRSMQPKKKRCERCGLYYTESLDKCQHCGDLNDHELKMLLDNKEQEFKSNASIGKYFLMFALIIAVFLIFF
jgi:hypothetical protein